MTNKYKRYVDMALRANNVQLCESILNIAIATVEAVQQKGGKLDLKDIVKIEGNKDKLL